MRQSGNARTHRLLLLVSCWNFCCVPGFSADDLGRELHANVEYRARRHYEVTAEDLQSYVRVDEIARLLLRAEYYERQGDYDRALEDLYAARNLDEDNVLVASAITRVEAARSRRTNPNIEELGAAIKGITNILYANPQPGQSDLRPVPVRARLGGHSRAKNRATARLARQAPAYDARSRVKAPRLTLKQPSKDVTRRLPVDTVAAHWVVKPGKDYALFVATNQYNDSNFAPLSNPIEDARALAGELHAQYGWETRILENPSADNILSSLRQYSRKRYCSDDQLLVFFSGHGTFDAETELAYFVATDSKYDDPNKRTCVDAAELIATIDHIKCNHTLICMDACHAGSFVDSVARKFGAMPRGQDMYSNMSWQELWKVYGGFRTRKVLAASANSPVSDGVRGEHSPLVKKLLYALREDARKDGFLSMSKLTSLVETVRPGARTFDLPSNEPGSEFFFIPNHIAPAEASTAIAYGESPLPPQSKKDKSTLVRSSAPKDAESQSQLSSSLGFIALLTAGAALMLAIVAFLYHFRRDS